MLPNLYLDFFDIFSLAMRKLMPVIKASALAILLMTIVKNFFAYFPVVSPNIWLHYVTTLIQALLFIYFWTVSLQASYEILQNNSCSLGGAYAKARKKVVQIYAVLIFYFLLAMVLLLLGRMVASILIWGHINPFLANAITFFLITAFPYLFLAALFIISFPLIIMNEWLFWQALKRAVTWMGWINWLWCLSLYIVAFIIYFLVLPDTLHGYFLQKYYLSAPFDFIVFLIFIPLLNNLFILIANNLQLKQKNEATIRPG